jgi:hypothetical protein
VRKRDGWRSPLWDGCSVSASEEDAREVGGGGRERERKREFNSNYSEALTPASRDFRASIWRNMPPATRRKSHDKRLVARPAPISRSTTQAPPPARATARHERWHEPVAQVSVAEAAGHLRVSIV